MLNLLHKDTSLNRLVRTSFSISGANNFGSKRWFILFSIYQALINIYVIIITVTEIIIGSKEVKDIVSTLSTGIAGFLGLLKLLRFLSKTTQVQIIVDKLECIRQKMLQDERIRDEVIKAEIFGRKISLTILSVLDLVFPISALLIAFIADIMSKFQEKHLVVKVWLPWSREETWVHILTNGWLTVITIACLSVFGAFFVFEITFSIYLSLYIKSLQNNLINKRINNEEIYEQHKEINQLLSDYNELLSGQMYIETLVSPLMPCGYGLASIRALQKKDLNQSFHSVLRTLMAFLPCTISCCCGQLIITQMERLHEASYMSNWYEEKPKIRKDLLMLMINTTNPKSINYRLFVTFDHVLLSSVLQVIYSYFMLMVNMEAKK